MEQDVLSQVIEAEKEIQKCLESEKAKVRDWVEEVRREFEAASLAEERKIRESQALSEAESARSAESKAGEIIEAAEEHSACLQSLSPETIKRIVERRITKILPG